MLTGGCIVGTPEEVTPPPDNDPDPPPATRSGTIREPTLGTVFHGDPSTISIRVAGTFDEPDHRLEVQVLSDPDDLSSWLTIAETRTSSNGTGAASFAADIRPVSDASAAGRWPSGGVLRIRVVDDDGRALPFDETAPEDTVLVVTNPGALPAGWTYLTEKEPGSVEETIEYYQAIDAPPTLDDFITRYAFEDDDVSALYYNIGDLGIGREMHCRATADPAGGLACYVLNFGTFGGDPDDAIDAMLAGDAPLATVAMVYAPPIDAPNAVSFLVYGPDGTLANEAQLDTFGDNTSVPQNCLNCHGGRSRYDAETNAVYGARFLPFDPAAFSYPARADLSLIAQEDRFRRLNRLVEAAGSTAAAREMSAGLFPIDNTPYSPGFVPPGWNRTSGDARVYRQVIAPYCRSCHVSFENGANDPLAFPSADSLRTRAAAVAQRICGEGPRGMPTAEQTTRAFFDSPARAVMLQWLGVPGACAPQVALP